ncbi:hypothetical protein DH2020_026949 [Rehmannia glutinosa]|uniref:Uncharacterized protein n=1 Tax=Rehmannia glutinosa TaxID=99300 RepID=A0ABR0VVH2_REHGL
MGSLVETDQSPSSHHLNMLQEVVDSRGVEQNRYKKGQTSKGKKKGSCYSDDETEKEQELEYSQEQPKVSWKTGVHEATPDTKGHGTHCASIAAGNYVKDASFYGIAKGTARGGVPSARVAAYKVCGMEGCETTEILAAFDDAIADGVDIITISIGGRSPEKLNYDVIAIGSLHALEKGILVVQAAGNSAKKNTTGKAVNRFSLPGTGVPAVIGKDASKGCDKIAAQGCRCLDSSLAKGKIVLCDTNLATGEVAGVGAVGIVATFDPTSLIAAIFNFSGEVPLPASRLNEQDYKAVQSYISSTKFPKLDVLKSESVRNIDAPVVASFSSRGPNVILPDILKPDITAPGVEILAACPPIDKNTARYHVKSGTSMACLHVAGSAAYVKTFHPNWSPSVIKSALMTTAWKMDPTNDSLAEFSYGAGHIDPVKAVDPGLVYETLLEDYIEMLCSLGYDNATLRKMFGVNATCPVGVQTTPKDLNYPSMTSRVMATQGSKSITFSEKFTRTVTNVGVGNSTYKATTSKSPDYNIAVKPDILTFGAVNEKKSFDVIISGKIDYGEMVSASLEWSDGVHRVRSPIVVHPTMAKFNSSKIFILLILSVVALITPIHSSDVETKVYMGNLVETDESPSSYHFNMLQEVVDSR